RSLTGGVLRGPGRPDGVRRGRPASGCRRPRSEPVSQAVASVRDAHVDAKRAVDRSRIEPTTEKRRALTHAGEAVSTGLRTLCRYRVGDREVNSSVSEREVYARRSPPMSTP